MSRLMRALHRRLRSRGAERGAAAVLVAILVGSGVLFGMGAMVVDVGQLYAEKAQLQNGADAGALAVALSCSRGSCAASTSQTGLAGTYATSNHRSMSGSEHIDAVCGSDAGGALPTCAANAPGCPATPTSGYYAQVQTSTLTSSGSSLLPPVFAQTFMGSSYQGTTTHACARAGWGSPESVSNVLAMTLSLCEWNADTANGTNFAPPGPSYPAWPAASYEHVIQIHGTGNACAGGQSGYDMPGGFGWLTADTGGNCTTTVDVVTGLYFDQTGASPSKNCGKALMNNYATSPHTPVYLPVFDGLCSPSGTCTPKSSYHLAGFAAFVITGFYMQGQVKQPSLITGNDYCSGSQFCVYGFFTQALIPNGTGSVTKSFGGTSVSMIG
jgi:Flp pilus assembly protein TadG